MKPLRKFPFNQIQAIMKAVKVNQMDHNTLTQIMNALGSFPYENVAPLLENVNSYIEMVQPDEELAAPEIPQVVD
ncbi:MAG: hypothetical protein HC831_24225 [Chloroflexia bacterium]|nr:hypothetical protein [Chloroflexia bacterium]